MRQWSRTSTWSKEKVGALETSRKKSQMESHHPHPFPPLSHKKVLHHPLFRFPLWHALPSNFFFPDISSFPLAVQTSSPISLKVSGGEGCEEETILEKSGSVEVEVSGETWQRIRSCQKTGNEKRQGGIGESTSTFEIQNPAPYHQFWRRSFWFNFSCDCAHYQSESTNDSNSWRSGHRGIE